MRNVAPGDGGTVVIRQAGGADLTGLAELFDNYRQFYEQAPDRELAQRFLSERMSRGESVVLVADGGASGLLGFCQLFPSFCSVEAAPIYVVYDLFVQRGIRRAGVGRRLLQAAEARARADGMVRMDLTTARTNSMAQSLYESLGWVLDTVFLAYNRRVS